MEGLTAVLLVAFVTIGSSIINTKYAARTLNGEGNFVVGSGHDSTFSIQHLDGNVRDIARVGGDAHSIDQESELCRTVRRLHLQRPNDLAFLYSVGRECSRRIGHIP
jgi:hypothetical protein